MQSNKIITIEDVIGKLKGKISEEDIKLVEKAYNFANDNHQGQKRMSGEDYINHPLSVAYILADLELDSSTICVALLHDVVEDTAITNDTVKELFGEEIAQMVEGVTKLRKNSIYHSRRTTSRRL